MDSTREIVLKAEELPNKWYNILPDLPEPLPPPKDPPEGYSRVKDLPNMLLSECLKQEMSDQRWISIPEGIRDLFLSAGRPRPLFRATKELASAQPSKPWSINLKANPMAGI